MGAEFDNWESEVHNWQPENSVKETLHVSVQVLGLCVMYRDAFAAQRLVYLHIDTEPKEI